MTTDQVLYFHSGRILATVIATCWYHIIIQLDFVDNGDVFIEESTVWTLRSGPYGGKVLFELLFVMNLRMFKTNHDRDFERPVMH